MPQFVEPGRSYFRCPDCHLIFLHREDRPTPLAEVMRYLHHENRPDDAEYLRFLGRIADPLCNVVNAGGRGLDFGCGPSPVLGELLTASGRPTVSYDPLFRARTELLDERYDFVTCCEVAEHAHDPAALFAQLEGLLLPGGTLAVMTSFHGPDTPFERWWYRRDLTHVCFYDAHTFAHIAARFEWRLSLPVPNVGIFTAHAAQVTPAR